MENQAHSTSFLSRFFLRIGDRLAAYLSKPRASYKAFSVLSEAQLKSSLQEGDLILVEGNSKISTAIKYLTQSTWSHVGVYIGEHEGMKSILEADLVHGVITVPINKYDGFNLRICRPHKLSENDKKALLHFLIARIGVQYDTKNIVDLLRYLLPTPPVPVRFRRALLTLGSGDPTKAICSTLVAEAFQSINYPILPISLEQQGEHCDMLSKKEICGGQLAIMRRKHHSHFTPRDFDLSPYFNIIKPTLNDGFDYADIAWDLSPQETPLVSESAQSTENTEPAEKKVS